MEQRYFLYDFVQKLVEAGMGCPYQTSSWSSAPLFVPKSGLTKSRFTVYLNPISKYTVKHQFPMQITDEKLTKFVGPHFCATSAYCNGYW